MHATSETISAVTAAAPLELVEPDAVPLTWEEWANTFPDRAIEFDRLHLLGMDEHGARKGFIHGNDVIQRLLVNELEIDLQEAAGMYQLLAYVASGDTGLARKAVNAFAQSLRDLVERKGRLSIANAVVGNFLKDWQAARDARAAGGETRSQKYTRLLGQYSEAEPIAMKRVIADAADHERRSTPAPDADAMDDERFDGLHA